MDNILDLPERSLPVFNNKVGGLHTTPGIYIAIVIMLLGSWLMRVHPLGFIFYLLCIPFFFSSSWISVDVNSKMVCRYWKLAGISIGEGNWQSLPQINAVTIIRVKWTQTVGSRGTQTTMSDFLYRVKIAGEGRNVWDLLTAESREAALIKAGEIAAALNVKLIDYTDSSRRTANRRR